MKNIKEFKKLFKINIPVEEHFDYYIDVLSESKEYENIKDLVSEYEKYEIHCEDTKFKNSKSYKLDHALPLLVSHIKQTNAYKSLMKEDFSNAGFRTKNTLKDNDNTYLMSIDFSSANYSALKTYDKDNELFENWDELCEKKHIHPVLAKSKSFRQLVFGNTSPKRLQRHQHRNTVKIINELIDFYGFVEDDFVFISHDEFVVKLRPDHKLAVSRFIKLIRSVDEIINKLDIGMKVHSRVYKNEAIDKKMSVQTIYNIKMGGLSESHLVLHQVPGDKYFKIFKKYILKESIDNRDLLFVNNGDLAIWVND